MKQCLWCHQPFTPTLQLAELLSWHQLIPPLLCANCQRIFKRIDQRIACPGCGRAQTQPRLCRDCQRWQHTTEPCVPNHALFQYTTSMSTFFQRYKTQGDYQLRQLFQPTLKRYFRHSKAILVPVPPDPQRYRQRGFDAVQGLFAGCGNWVPCLQKQAGPKQSQQKRKLRLQTAQPFSMQASYLTKPLARPIIIVDDVYTTGRTLHHAQACLQAAWPDAQIQTFTLAR